MAITDWPSAERPREKLLKDGANLLSDAELLALLLGSGIKGKSAVDTARNLLQQTGGIRALLTTQQHDILSLPGIGKANYARLQAALEISRRFLGEKLQRHNLLDNSLAVNDYLRSALQDLAHEVFGCLMLDAKLRLISFDILFKGTLDQSAVYPREVMKVVLKRNASSVILVHNHPSGVAEPSDADKFLTKHLQKIFSHVGVRLLDHLIVGDGEIISMREKGYD